ncbi:MAG: hypothetical protein H6Q69_1040 [Firmicutes bacterium]|nr:hypothetical protein [Bacillota bacterium]
MVSAELAENKMHFVPTRVKLPWLCNTWNAGYCITCHAFQGSEWDNIVLYDDSWPDRNDPKQQARWRFSLLSL